MTKFLLKVLPYSLFCRIYYNYFRVRKINFLNEITKDDKYKNLKDIDINSFKNSRKLFIIGSGNSLNNIIPSQWDEINSNDTFGFNFSFLNNDHIPTYYTFEAVAPKEKHPESAPIGELHKVLLRKKKEEYRNVLKFITDLEEERFSTFDDTGRDLLDENFYVLNTVNGIAGNKQQFEKLINYYKTIGVFNHKKYVDEVFKFRATISMAISFAINLGYEEIILCGIDLNDPRYFYQDRSRYPDLPVFRSSIDTPKHATILPQALFAPIDTVVKGIYENVCIEKGIKLFIQNPDSALNEFLPVYEFNKE